MIAVGVGIGVQIRQTLQNQDGVDQNARNHFSFEERMNTLEEHGKLWSEMIRNVLSLSYLLNKHAGTTDYNYIFNIFQIFWIIHICNEE